MFNGESLELWACKISDTKKKTDKEFSKRVNERLTKKKNTKNLAMQFLADVALKSQASKCKHLQKTGDRLQNYIDRKENPDLLRGNSSAVNQQ